MVLEVRTLWGGLGHSPKYSVMYFTGTDATAASAAVTATHDLWQSVVARLSNTMTARVQGEVKQLNDATGALVAVYAGADAPPVVGSNTNQQVPDASQVLIRWGTGTVVAGRLLKGRTFVPGTTVNDLTSGNLNGAAQTTWNTALTSWLGTVPGLEVWHRPTTSNPTGGTVAVVTSGSVWEEFGSQRRRRG